MRYEYEAISNEMEPMLTVKEVSRMIHVHPNTIRRWSNQGIMKVVRINSRGDRRFRRSDIAFFLAELRGISLFTSIINPLTL